MSAVFCKKTRFFDGIFRKNTIFVAEKEDVYDTDNINHKQDHDFHDNNLLSQTVLDVLQQILAGFEADAEADGGFWDGHLRTLFWGEETEDGRGGMDGQRLAVEEVRSATNNLQPVDELPRCFFRFEVDSEDGTR